MLLAGVAADASSGALICLFRLGRHKAATLGMVVGSIKNKRGRHCICCCTVHVQPLTQPFTKITYDKKPAIEPQTRLDLQVAVAAAAASSGCV